MNIIIIGPCDNSKGGIASYINNLIEYSKDKKINYIKINSHSNKNIFGKILVLLKSYIIFLKVLIKEKNVIVHLNVAPRGSLIRKSFFLILANLMSVKTIVHIHSGEFCEYYKFRKKYIVRRILHKANKIIVLNEAMKKDFSNLFDLESVVLINGIKVNKKYNYNPENKDVLFLGRVTEKKGVFDLLEAINLIVKRYKIEYKFIIAGDGDLERVEEYIRLNRLEEYIYCTGWINNQKKDELLKKSGILVLPSYFEGIPISILEAINYGIPVIGTNISGINSIIINKETGILVDKSNSLELSEKIYELNNNIRMKEKISFNSRNYLINNLSIEKHFDELYHIYSEI